MIAPATLSRPSAKERARYRPYGAAYQAWRSRRREVLLAGPSNTGKSRAALEKLHFCMDKYPGSRGIMLRKIRKDLTRSAMVTYEQKVLPQGWLDRLIHFNVTDQQYEYPNGSIIAVAGLDDPQRVMSSEWDMIVFQEATEGNEGDWEALTIRLRWHSMPYQQILGDCNPGPPTHWLKRRCDRLATLMLNSRHEDNPSITPEDMAVLDALTGVRYLRYRKGIWAAAEGMVFPEWDRAIHLITRQQLIDWGVFYSDGTLNRQVIRHVIGGVDWGYANPGVLHIYGVDSDNRLYLLREVYQTHHTIDWWIREARELNQTFKVERWVADPSRPDYIAQFNEAGLPTTGAKNAIALGVGFLRSRLRVAGDGRSRYFVYEYSLSERDESLDEQKKPVCFEQEIDAYVWAKAKDGQPLKEEPVDDANHALDVARYVAAELDAGGDLDALDAETAEALATYRGY